MSDDIEFRDVRDGDDIPIEHAPDHIYWPAVFRWLCPSLTAEDADRIYEMGRDRMMAVNTESMKALVREYFATKGARGR